MKASITNFILQKLASNIPVMLLQVVHSEGSSPGRQGFQMAIAIDEKLSGSIGGGIMEHKLVEYSKKKLSAKENNIELKHQYHDKSHATQQSGMICSGYQVIAFFPFYKKDLELFQEIAQAIKNRKTNYLHFSPGGLSILSKKEQTLPTGFQQKTATDWSYLEKINPQKII